MRFYALIINNLLFLLSFLSFLSILDPNFLHYRQCVPNDVAQNRNRNSNDKHVNHLQNKAQKKKKMVTSS